MIEAKALSKRYDTVVALDGVDISVGTGQIYALLGPNGAGKTTTLSILTTLIQPSGGSATIGGHDILRAPNKVRQMIGVTFQDIVLDPDLTGREVLDVHGQLYQIPAAQRRARIAELAELVQLSDALGRMVKTYSGGMKRRLELARGLMTKPSLLFLDEPTQGLDPQNRVAIWDHIRTLNQQEGLTLLLTTHYMDEAEALAGRVGIIDHGKMAAEGSPAELVAGMGSDVVRIVGRGDSSHFLENLNALPYIDAVSYSPEDRVIQIGVDSGSQRLAEIIAQAGGNGYRIDDVMIARPSLGDVFLKYTGRALRD
ncbi:ATP-binding cassette domain-containing protein [Chloroflexia bacterium SDU3-3]|nr:ATP-binding cassette domain-containing protein [Chloroflexia bacterium SDU3-3]